VVFSVVSGPGSITGGTALYSTGVGTIVVAANQAGNSSYSTAPQVTQSVVVQQAGQTITIYPMASVTYGVGTVNLSTTAMATASSGLPITYSVISGPGTVSGTTLTVTGGGEHCDRCKSGGKCVLSRSAAGHYYAAGSSGEPDGYSGDLPIIRHLWRDAHNCLNWDSVVGSSGDIPIAVRSWDLGRKYTHYHGCWNNMAGGLSGWERQLLRWSLAQLYDHRVASYADVVGCLIWLAIGLWVADYVHCDDNKRSDRLYYFHRCD
jgi:hypothetical protein